MKSLTTRIYESFNNLNESLKYRGKEIKDTFENQIFKTEKEAYDFAKDEMGWDESDILEGSGKVSFKTSDNEVIDTKLKCIYVDSGSDDYIYWLGDEVNEVKEYYIIDILLTSGERNYWNGESKQRNVKYISMAQKFDTEKEALEEVEKVVKPFYKRKNITPFEEINVIKTKDKPTKAGLGKGGGIITKRQ